MSGKFKVSVIIPCYNSGKTILNTLNSLEMQTTNDFEVIIVDDGSDDETPNIVRNYNSKLKDRINLIITKNKGVSHARNIGLKSSKADLIMFLDSDDIYSKFYIELMTKIIENKDVDLVLTKYKNLDINDDYSYFDEEINLYDDYKKIDRYELFDIYKHHKLNKVNFVNGIYKRNIIKENHLYFSEDIKYGEDSEFLFKYIFHCINGGYFIDRVMYGYYNNSASTTKKNSLQYYRYN